MQGPLFCDALWRYREAKRGYVTSVRPVAGGNALGGEGANYTAHRKRIRATFSEFYREIDYELSYGIKCNNNNTPWNSVPIHAREYRVYTGCFLIRVNNFR